MSFCFRPDIGPTSLTYKPAFFRIAKCEVMPLASVINILQKNWKKINIFIHIFIYT